jgi:hypothetical protein
MEGFSMNQNGTTEIRKPGKREVLGVEELSEQDIRDIAAAEVPSEYAYLDELLD